MANIQSVDYEAIPSQAKQIRTEGQAMNTELTKAYASIGDMHKDWYGNRYNDLVAAFNGMVQELNDMLTLVIGDIPFTLESISNNYSQADRGTNVTSAVQTPPKKITNIATSKDVGMRFITSSVEQVKQSVTNNFNNAKNKMDTIESIYNKIQWQSEASEAFRVKFKKLKDNITREFENINETFKTLMTQALNDIQSAEKSNTVN